MIDGYVQGSTEGQRDISQVAALLDESGNNIKLRG